MATLRLYQRPANFRLPIRYQRLPLGEVTEGRLENFSFARRINSDIVGFTVYQVGAIINISKEIEFPEANGMVPRNITYPQIYYYRVYVPERDDGYIYCVGNSIDFVEQPLMDQINLTEIGRVAFNLHALETAFNNGQLPVMGQTCILDNGTRRLHHRKINGQPFTTRDTTFETGEGVQQEIFELPVVFEGTTRYFYVYGNGTISFRGRLPSGTDGFHMLRTAYQYVRRLLRNAGN